MKTIKFQKLFLLLMFVGMSISTFAVKEKTKSEVRNVGAFSSIHVSSGIDLFLTQGGSREVKVEADGELIDKIMTKVENGVLKIFIEDKMNWDLRWNMVRKAYVTFTDLEQLHASAGSDVHSLNAFRLKELGIDASSGSDIQLDDLTADFVRVHSSSGADVELSGKTVRLEADASSGSDVDCEKLISKDCDASASSGADVAVHVTGSLKARASSAGDIHYTGNPQSRDVNESSGGDIAGN